MTAENHVGWGPNSMPRPSEPEMLRIHGMVRRGELHPVMNNTKWAELRSEMLSASTEQAPKFRAHSVLAPQEFCTDWDGDFYYHLHPVADIEWMELQAASAIWLREALLRHNIPFSVEAGIVRVWGYTRPGIQPEWQ